MVDVIAKFEEADILAPKLAAEYAAKAAELPILDANTTPLLHEPVYDFARDEFICPCAEDDFDRREGSRWISRGELVDFFHDYATQELHVRFDLVRPRTNVLVQAPDYIVIIAPAGHIQKPGLYIDRLVRVGEDLWHKYRWRTGAGPQSTGIGSIGGWFGLESGSDGDDPPVLATNIVNKPQAWLDRERILRERWRKNDNWQSAARQCPHRNAGTRSKTTSHPAEAGDEAGKVIVACPNAGCGQQIRVPAGRSGTIKCPSCGNPFSAST